MTNKKLAELAVTALKAEYPSAECSLKYTDPLQLLIATRLAAQCTDARVNMVTPELFERYKTLDDYCNADVKDIEKIIHSCGFYKSKAESIIDMAKAVRDRFGGVVPDNIEDLITLNGVGRKTANLIVGDVYGKPSVVTDTHVIRITNLLGLCSSKDPYKVEMKLRSLLPPEKSGDFCHRVVIHGRAVCVARNPKCDNCVLNSVCKFAGAK